MIFLSPDMLTKLNLKPGEEVFFSAGNKKIATVVEKNNVSDNSFYIDPHLLGKAFLRGVNQPLSLYFKKGENELKIGPIVAILNDVPVMLLQPNVISLYKTIAAVARDAGMLFYLFTPYLIDFNKGTVNGFIYRPYSHSNHDWVMQEFPLPDVVFNQVGSINKNLKPVFRQLMLNFLKEHAGVKLINPFLAVNDKMITHDILCCAQQVKAYLPETRKYRNDHDVLVMLRKYGAVYLKPTASSLGKGVYKVGLLDHDRYIIEFHQSKDKKIITIAKGKDKLLESLQVKMAEQPYLLQQPINLIQHVNRPVDFRVHLFKNKLGCWDLLAVKARLGPVGGIVTGTAWGGLSMQGEKLLEKVYSHCDAVNILGAIVKGTLALARALEYYYSIEFGELGFDMAVDRDKKVWMIEVNFKPNWNVPREADAAKTEEKFTDHLLGYCQYLLKLNDINTCLGIPAQDYKPQA